MRERGVRPGLGLQAEIPPSDGRKPSIPGWCLFPNNSMTTLFISSYDYPRFVVRILQRKLVDIWEQKRKNTVPKVIIGKL